MVESVPSAFASASSFASATNCSKPPAAADADADALSDGAVDALSDGAADDGAVVAVPPLEHAAKMMAVAASRPAQRVRSRFMVNRASSKSRK
jgi:hypothetical protein